MFKFVRTINGVKLFNKGFKFVEDDAAHVKKVWPKECIIVKINDDGIVGFDYNAPIEITETVVDQANMQSFEKVKEVFEKMVLVANASKFDVEKKMSVKRVMLGYERISEKDSFDTGLLVPAWDFQGSGAGNSMNVYNGSILTINAIDGSIINRELGY